MGSYNYTFKKASRNITDEGVKTIVQHLSYAYKLSNAWFPEARYVTYCALRDSQAERSFEDYDGGYIVIADVKDEDGKISNLEGQKVYKNLQKSYWIDCNELEMEYVGYLVKKGRSYELVHAVEQYEDDRAKVVAELHVKSDYDPQYVRYHFTNKETGETSLKYMEPKQSEYALMMTKVYSPNKDKKNLAEIVFGMVI